MHIHVVQVISSCRNGQVIVWDLTNEDKEHSFSWSPGQRGQNRDEKKPVYRFRACWYALLELIKFPNSGRPD